jgi:hypothetical protein
MKKLLFRTMMVVGMTTALVACEKEEDSTSTTGGSILGTWEATSSRSVEKMNGQTITDTTETYAANEMLVTFYANGTAINIEDGVADTAQYALNGNQLLIIESDPVFGDDTVIMNATITSTNLKLFQEYSETYQGVVYSGSYEINLKKK